MKIHDVTGGGGVRLHVREWGEKAAPPILLIHGWSQNHLCWIRQFQSALQEECRLVAFDLRGHGMSDAPMDPGQYTDGDKWADDVAAIIDRLALDKAVLVGWSYGGFVIADYLRKYGQQNVAAIDLVSAAVVLGPKAFGPLIGPGFLEYAPGAFAPDLPTNIAAIRKFLRCCFAKPVPQDDFELALAFNMTVPAKVRGFLTARELDCGPVLDEINVPTLVTHGRADSVVLPAMGEYTLAHCKTAKGSWYEGVGHAPFLEEPERFNRELRQLATTARLALAG